METEAEKYFATEFTLFCNSKFGDSLHSTFVFVFLPF